MPYGISNSFKRGTMRTYAGRAKGLFANPYAESPRFRITMDVNGMIKKEILGKVQAPAPPPKEPTETSSPAASSRALFSDAEHNASISPPSSPPLHRGSPPLKARKPTFSFLKRKRSSTDDVSEPLTEVNDNAKSRRPPPAKRTRLTQMQIDLGGEVRRRCKECGMEYIPSNREDSTLHKEYHSMNIGGVDLGAGFTKDAKVIEKYGFGEVVAMVDAKTPPGTRRRTKRVLDVVRSDLGAVEIDEEALWGAKNMHSAKKMKGKRETPKAESEEEGNGGRYKLFLYLAADKCVGLCLAERIRHASRVVRAEKAADSDAVLDSSPSCLQTETSIDGMLLGISRIWVSKSHRRKAIATTLLDGARSNFFYGIEVPKKMVAFSQPTESGRQLAEGWYGESIGWHVYAD